MIGNQILTAYLSYCKLQKNLDSKTIKAYSIDLNQFSCLYPCPAAVSRSEMEQYIEYLMSQHKASTVKRKIAALKAFYRYLVYEDILECSPFEKIQLHIRQENLLPRIIDRRALESIFSAAYEELYKPGSFSAHRNAIRDVAILELLFASGVRVSELCTITCDNLNLDGQVVLIRGKGSKERRIYLSSHFVLQSLRAYSQVRSPRDPSEQFFFLNRDGKRLSEQSVRRIINHYTNLAHEPGHYTPHMFRHSFATYLWDACGDVYEVKEILGHSSIKTTERYVHASFERQKKVLSAMNPREQLNVSY